MERREEHDNTLDCLCVLCVLCVLCGFMQYPGIARSPDGIIPFRKNPLLTLKCPFPCSHGKFL